MPPQAAKVERSEDDAQQGGENKGMARPTAPIAPEHVAKKHPRGVGSAWKGHSPLRHVPGLVRFCTDIQFMAKLVALPRLKQSGRRMDTFLGLGADLGMIRGFAATQGALELQEARGAPHENAKAVASTSPQGARIDQFTCVPRVRRK